MEDQGEAMDLSAKPFVCGTCFKSFKHNRYRIQHEQKHKLPAATCKLCQPPVSFRWRNAIVNHRAKVHGVLPYLCAEGLCEEAFATSAELKEHGKEKHTKCDRCDGEFLNPAGLKLHQKKCKESDDPENRPSAISIDNRPSAISIDSGVTSDESRDSRISEISSSSSILSSESRYRDSTSHSTSRDSEDKIVYCSRQITADMRHVTFGLPTATTALIFAHSRSITDVDEPFLDEILNEGQALFEARSRRSSNPDTPHGTVSPSQMEGPIESELSGVCVEVTFSPQGASNVQHSFVGSLNRSELFQDLKRFGKGNPAKGRIGVLQVGDFYMALVFKNDRLYVVNPGIGSSSDLPHARPNKDNISLLNYHRREWHLLVDKLIDAFKLENPDSAQLNYKIMTMSILSCQEL